MNETELLKAFRTDRSEAAFAELVRRYAALVYSTAKRRLDNASLAEDVTQLVFIRLAKTPPDIKTPGELAAWLHRTTVNVAIDAWRSETRRRNREQQSVAMESTTPPAWEEISPKLDQAVNQLDDEDRQAILLRFFGQKTMRDVGAALGVSEGAAKMRVGRAVDRLRKQIGVGGIACTAVVLGTILAEHSAEAAPAQMVSRLAAMRLPEVAASGAKAGLAHKLTRISKLKMAAGVAVVTSLSLALLHFARSSHEAAVDSNASTDRIEKPREANRATSFDEASPAEPATKSSKILLHVLDAETGSALPSAQIHFIYFGAGDNESHETVADENGTAALQSPDDPTKNSAPNVFVTAEGHVTKMVSPLTNDYTVSLDPAMTIGGLIMDNHGAPVPGVKIYFQYVQGMENRSMEREGVDFPNFPVTSRDDGSWTCSYIPKDWTNDIHLILKKPGYAVTFRMVSVPYKATFQGYIDLANLILEMDSGTTVTGIVTDEHSRPIANARVKIVARDQNERQTVRTDENGIFTLTGVPGEGSILKGQQYETLKTNAAGRVLIVRTADPKELQSQLKGVLLPFDDPPSLNIAVQADGFASEAKTVKQVEATNFIAFKLPPGNVFHGRVVDDAGNPISNAVVQTDYPSGQERKFDWTARTDADGVCFWDSAPAEETAYWIEADGYEAVRNLQLTADGTDQVITLKRKPVD